MSRAKEKGTRFESAVCSYLRERLDDDRIERRALHGSRDMGDLFGIRAHGFEGIAECKSHKSVTPTLVSLWREEALEERGNADAGFVLLVIDVYRSALKRSEVHVTMRDLARIALTVSVADEDKADCEWVVLTLEQAARLMSGR